MTPIKKPNKAVTNVLRPASLVRFTRSGDSSARLVKAMTVTKDRADATIDSVKDIKETTTNSFHFGRGKIFSRKAICKASDPVERVVKCFK